MAETSRRRIVVLGAGYGGLAAFLELQDRLDRRRFDLALVNITPYHYFVTQLHTLAAGMQDEERVRVPLRRLTRPPGRLLVRQVQRILLSERAVACVDGPPLPYDYCVIALGSDPEYFGLPGVAENALVVSTPAGAQELRQRIVQQVSCRGAEPVPVVVIGAGLTGVEVAGELVDAYPHCLAVTLVEAGPEIMPGFDRFLAQAARRVLERKGIVIQTDAPVTQVTATAVQLRTAQLLPYDVLVWAGGVRGNAILADSGFVTSHRGRVETDPCLHAAGHADIYVVGDAAYVLDPETGSELPPTAQAAVQMGRHAARNLLAQLAGQPEQPFVPRLRGAFASLGRDAGVGYRGDGRYTGLPASIIKRLIEAHYAYEAGGLVPLLARALQPIARAFSLRRRPPIPGAGHPAPADAGAPSTLGPGSSLVSGEVPG